MTTRWIDMNKIMCKKCKEKEIFWGCSQFNSPYCITCHNKRNIIQRFFQAFMKVPFFKLGTAEVQKR